MAQSKLETAKRYADALFSVLENDGKLDEGNDDLTAIKKIFEDNPSLEVDLCAPVLNQEQKDSLMKPLIDGADLPVIKNFLTMVYDYGRIGDLLAIIDQFGKLYDKKNGIVRANATTAVPLSASQKDALANTLKKRINAKEVQLTNDVNQDIIGGIILTSSDVVYDGSVRSRINEVKRLLLG